MQTNTLLLVAAVGAIAFLVLKRDQAQQAAVPGGARQPPGPATAYTQGTTGPNGTAQTLVQQFGGAPGIADAAVKLSNGAVDLWSRIASNPDDTSTDNWPA